MGLAILVASLNSCCLKQYYISNQLSQFKITYLNICNVFCNVITIKNEGTPPSGRGYVHVYCV